MVLSSGLCAQSSPEHPEAAPQLPAVLSTHTDSEHLLPTSPTRTLSARSEEQLQARRVPGKGERWKSSVWVPGTTGTG